MRYASVLLPPALLLTSSIGGGLIGNHASNSHGDLFVAFNTFSAVALLLLACNVLLIEARNTHDSISYPSWWEPAVLVFAGVYLVVVGDCIISSQQ